MYVCAVLCAGERRFFDASGCVAFLFGIKHKLGCCVFVCESSHPHYSTEIEKAQSGALNLICIDVLMCHGRMSYHIRFITCSQTRTHTFLFVTYFHFLFVGSGAPALIYVFMYKLIAKHQSNFVWVCMFVCYCTQTGDLWQSANDSNDLSITYTYTHTLFVSITSIHVNLDLCVYLLSFSLFRLFSFDWHSYMVQ